MALVSRLVYSKNVGRIVTLALCVYANKYTQVETFSFYGKFRSCLFTSFDRLNTLEGHDDKCPNSQDKIRQGGTMSSYL